MSSVKNTTSVDNTKLALQNSSTSKENTSNTNGSIFADKIDVSDYKKGELGTQKDKDIISDLNKEFNIRSGGSNRLDWENYMRSGVKKDQIAIYDPKTGERLDPSKAAKIAAGEKGAGMIKGGYIMEVKSEKYGLVKIQVGGDGEINGRDDVVRTEATKSATQAATTGLSNISNNMSAAASQQTTPNAVPGLMALTYPAFNYNKPYSSPFAYSFSSQEIRNLIAALLQSLNQN